uniref:Lipocln_cytosolic_FA-bd_dom domain-containing protein n=1 Tax=Steinernema glaseri TaxID=37863 RepID=A0A1I7ZB22_9BILA
FKNHSMEFELDKETELETADGRKMKSVFSLVDGKLVQKESPISSKDRPSEITRFIEGNKLIMLLKSGSVEAKRVYEKQ